MMPLHFTAANLLGRTTGRLLEGGQLDAADVVLIWDTTPPVDPNDESAAAAPTLMNATVRALIHYVSASAVGRMGMEFSAGDAILTFDGALRLLDKSGLRYRLPDGKLYGQQGTARGLDEIWDATLSGRRLSFTVLVRAKPDSGPKTGALLGEIRYRTGAVNVQLFQYDADGLFATGVGGNGGRLDFRTPGQVTAWFGSTLALRADADGTHVKAFTDTLATTFPRMEFWQGGILRATLTPDGTLAGEFTDIEPAAPFMQVQNGADLFTVGAQFYAASLSDDLLVAVAPLMPPPPSPPPPAPQPPW